MKEAWRANTVRWYLEVGTKLHLPLEVAERAVHYLDRYLTFHSVDGPCFRLAAAAALLISAKADDQLAFIDTPQLVRLTQNMFTARDLVRMEGKMLQTLEFCVNPPTATEAAAMFVDVLKHDPSTPTSALAATPEFSGSVREAIELCLPRLEFLPFSKTELAWAAIRYALAKHGESGEGADTAGGKGAPQGQAREVSGVLQQANPSVDGLVAGEILVGKAATEDEDDGDCFSSPSTTVDAWKAVVTEVSSSPVAVPAWTPAASHSAVVLSHTTAAEVRCFERMLRA